MAATLPADSHYFLPRDGTETQRLNRQHYLIKTAFKQQLVPSNITLPQEISIFDSATGTAIWLQDFVETHPAIHFIDIVGSDISADQFPSEKARRVGDVNLDLFVHDVTTPFPKRWHAKFDLVNQRLLVAGLKENQWSSALDNLASLLRPGGYLVIVEVLLQGPGNMKACKIFNEIMNAMELLGNRLDCITGAEDWMKAARFEDVQVSRVKWHCGADASEGEAFGVGSTDNVLAVVVNILKKVRANAPHLLPEEIQSVDEERMYLVDLRRSFNHVGAIGTLGMVTGRKCFKQ